MTSSPEPGEHDFAQQLAAEQAKVSEFYSGLDQLREHVDARLNQAQASTPTGTPSSIAEQEALVASLRDRRGMLAGVDHRLCFGRLDTADRQTHYIGRLGLSDDKQNPTLIDWRAEVAAPFYSATAVNPQGVVRRRHIATKDRTVTNLDDDVLDLDQLQELGLRHVVGHDSLLTSLDEARTGHMRDIVATIQSEQDRIIRAPMKGTVVVQGGPGTGKTVVALHRVAYLLYQHRDTIARQGALVVGPNRLFLEYIDQVLPALGETGVTLTTIDQLVPKVVPTHVDPPEVARVKGSAPMARVIKSLVESRQRTLTVPVAINVDGTKIMIEPDDVLHAARRARDTRKPHNEARRTFAKDMLNRLARKLAQALDLPMDEGTRQDLVADLRELKDVRREINLCWMPQDPQSLLHKFLGDPQMIVKVAPELSAQEQDLLAWQPPGDGAQRTTGFSWSSGDIALLDELDELLGVFDPYDDQQRNTGPSKDELAMARRSIEASGAFGGMMTADSLVARYGTDSATDPLLDPTQQRGWTYGHVVIDEAQELSPMQWRMIYRRVPSKSVTVVGDPAQTSSPAGASDWTAALAPFVGDRWTLERLTVNYRTPGTIMAVADAVLAAYGVAHAPGTTVREGRWPVEAIHLSELNAYLIKRQVDEVAALVEHGTIALIAQQELIPLLQSAVDLFSSEQEGGSYPSIDVTALSPQDSKGLEFDAVLLVEPSTIADREARPGQDLYVAMTRPTQLLRMLYSSELPTELYSSLIESR